jgi:transcriptional regulator
MHPNPVFRTAPEDRARAFAGARGFGVLTVATPEGVLAAHVPFLLDGDRVEAHLVRSNPIARALRGGVLEALLLVSGPDGYVSPDWYGEKDLVPTWNYVAVELRGALALSDEATLLAHLERVSARFEAALAPKPVWTHHKMSAGVMDRMMRSILPVEMAVAKVDSTFKLNQNRTASARAGAADALALGLTPGMETAALAALMRQGDG